jgi:hypothetical protein
MSSHPVARVIAVMAALSLASVPAGSQALYPRDAPTEPGAPSWALERAKLPPFDPLRMPDGRPDLRGRWGGTPGGDDLEAHPYIDVSTPPEESFVSDPPDGLIPYQSWARARRAEHRAGLARGWPGEKERLYADPQTYCLYSTPRATYRGGFDILQGPDYVILAFNFGHYHRYIPTDGRPKTAGPGIKTWMGLSRGAWEGDTLVVDVTNLNGRNWLDSVGNFFSDGARVIERFRLAAANIIDYEVTFEDPRVFTRPWRIRLPLRRVDLAGPNAAADPYVKEQWEHACFEGNRADDHMQTLGYRWFQGVVPPP